MTSGNSENLLPIPHIDEEVRDGIYHSVVPRQRGDQWDTLGITNPAFARDALIKAQQLRTEGKDAGEAYLEGLIDFLSAVAGQAILDSASTFDPDKDLEQLDDKL